MAGKIPRVLAVADPAVRAYTDPEHGLLAGLGGRRSLDFEVLPWVDYGARLEAERNKEEPDYDIVMIAGHLWLGDWAASGALAPLGGLGLDYGAFLPALRGDLEQGGEPYLVPSFTDGHLLFARREALERLPGGGLPARVSTKWLAEAATGLSRNGPALALKAHPSEIFLDWLPYLYDEGAFPFAPDGSPAFNNAAGRAALERYLSLRPFCLPGTANFGNEEVASALQSGRAALAMSWGGQAAAIAGKRPGDFAYAAPEKPWNVVWSFGLLSRSRWKEAAVEALALLSSPEADAAVARVAGSPVRSSSYEDPELLASCPWLPSQKAMAASARALPRFPGLGAEMRPLYARLAEAFSGKLGPSEALAAAEKDILAIRNS